MRPGFPRFERQMRFVCGITTRTPSFSTWWSLGQYGQTWPAQPSLLMSSQKSAAIHAKARLISSKMLAFDWCKACMISSSTKTSLQPVMPFPKGWPRAPNLFGKRTLASDLTSSNVRPNFASDERKSGPCSPTLMPPRQLLRYQQPVCHIDCLWQRGSIVTDPTRPQSSR